MIIFKCRAYFTELELIQVLHDTFFLEILRLSLQCCNAQYGLVPFRVFKLKIEPVKTFATGAWRVHVHFRCRRLCECVLTALLAKFRVQDLREKYLRCGMKMCREKATQNKMK